MPIYSYQCPKCFKVFERFSSVNNRYFQQCPDCQERANLVVSPCTFILKGDGWAKDNYQKKKDV